MRDNSKPAILSVGAGRMGRGIALAFAYAGHAVTLLDFKERDAAGFTSLAGEAQAEILSVLKNLAALGLFPHTQCAAIAERVSIVPYSASADILPEAAFIFEAVPEILDLKIDALQRVEKLAADDTIIASTTSTILADSLQVGLALPGRFLNAHWLNPAYLVPLVELSPGEATDPRYLEHMRTLLTDIGKVPVVCKASPGYIVPRIQALAMNEAARLVEEGVASAEDIDKATRYGFGFRFAILGLLEFIDWGGGDILYHASNYMTEATGDRRFAAPDIVNRFMQEGKTGLNAGSGFYDYSKVDSEKFRNTRMAAFVSLLQHMQMLKPPQ